MKTRKPKLTLTNRSAWPTPALDVLARWIVKRAGIDWDYSILVRDCKTNTWGGRGGRFGQRIWLDRHYRRAPGARGGVFCPVGCKLWPVAHTDRRFQWAHQQTFRTRMEFLVMLLAHEAYHATGGHPGNFVTGNKINRASMEFRCNRFADEAVAALRVEWPTIRAAIYRAMRRDRERAKSMKRVKADKRGPDHKLALAMAGLERWEKRERAARNRVKALRRKVKYYEGRVAAKRA